MGRQIRPARVYQAVTEELNQHMLKGHKMNEPAWYKVLRTIPPAETSIRNLPIAHEAPDARAKKPKNVFRPQEITYPEDALRKTFYKDHPWELARPRIILEFDGKDAQRCDWSKGLRQDGVPLNGECVVQRQLWLMENAGMSERKAYDVTRQEFYRLRQEEEIESRIAVEEARYVGAYFGKTRMEVGMQLEDAQFERWKTWAGTQVKQREALMTAGSDEEQLDDDLAGESAPGASFMQSAPPAAQSSPPPDTVMAKLRAAGSRTA